MFEKFKTNKQIIRDPELAEDMAYIEKPYREKFLAEMERLNEQIRLLKAIRAEYKKMLGKDMNGVTDQEFDASFSNVKLRLKSIIQEGEQQAERFKGHLSESEALKEASRIRGYLRLQMIEIIECTQRSLIRVGEKRQLGEKYLHEFNRLRNKLAQHPDEHIFPIEYEQALEYIEELEAIAISDFISWLKAKVDLISFELTDWVQNLQDKNNPDNPHI